MPRAPKRSPRVVTMTPRQLRALLLRLSLSSAALASASQLCDLLSHPRFNAAAQVRLRRSAARYQRSAVLRPARTKGVGSCRGVAEHSMTPCPTRPQSCVAHRVHDQARLARSLVLMFCFLKDHSVGRISFIEYFQEMILTM